MQSNKVGWGVAVLVALGAAVWYRAHVFSEPAVPEVRVAMVTGGSGPYWQLIANGARASAATNHVKLDIKIPTDNENVAEQTKLLSDLDLKACDGVALSPLDADAQTTLIDRLASDAVVVTFDSDAPKSRRMSYIGTSNLQAGRRAARLVQQAVPKGGKVAVVIANLTKDNMLERRAGFDEIMKAAGTASAEQGGPTTYQVLDYLVDEGDPKHTREIVQKALEDNPDLACLVGMNAFHGPILIDVLKGQDKIGKVAVVSFDEEAETLAGVESGAIYATVVQDPYRYGYETIKTLATLCRGEETQRPLKGTFSTLSIATMEVTKDSLDEFRAELSKRMKGAEVEGTK